MGNRKESLKNGLGINEYPWSSDDESENTQSTSVNGPPPANASPSPPSPRQGAAQQARMDRDFFWSLLNGRNRAAIPRNSSNVDLQLPPSRTHAQPPVESRASSSAASGAASGAVSGHRRCPCPASDLQRILAFRRIAENRSGTRQNSSRPFSNLFSAPRAQFSDAAAVLRARLMALQDSNRFPDNNNYDVEMRTASSGAAEAGGNGSSQHEDVSMLGSFYEDIEVPRPRSRPSSVVAVNGEVAGEQEATGGTGRMSALALDEAVLEIDVGPNVSGMVPLAAMVGVASGTDNAAAEGTSEENNNAGDRSVQRQGIKRKRDDNEELEPSTVQEFNVSLLRLLECPVCLECMEPPMSQCRRGHLVCARCRARLAACPVCRTAFSSVRNRAMEGVAEMLRYPCRHGCGREVRLRRRAPHEASCAARRYPCVSPACAQRPPLPHHELAPHMQTKHAAMLKVGRKHKFALKVNSAQQDTWVIMALHELFRLRIDVDIHTWGLVVHVAYIGPKCKANNYSYEVTVFGQHYSRKLVYTRATHCDLESTSQNMSRQDCFHLTIDQALNFLRIKNKHCETDKLLHFYVEITKSDTVAEVNMNDSDFS